MSEHRRPHDHLYTHHVDTPYERTIDDPDAPTGGALIIALAIALIAGAFALGYAGTRRGSVNLIAAGLATAGLGVGLIAGLWIRGRR